MKLSELFANCAWNVKYETIGDSVNYAFVEDIKTHTLYIYFQGSSQISDWVRNFLFTAKPYKDMEIPYRVHRGFLAAWKEVEKVIIDKVCEIDTPLLCHKWKHIVVVGYSHGGALAAFCHECVWYYRRDLRESGLEGYGFEAPRIYAGWHVKKKLKDRWKHFTVIRTNNDLVTHCPPAIFRFCHVGKIIKIHGDVKLGPDKWYIPNCIKSHYPQVVYDALIKHENEKYSTDEYLNMNDTSDLNKDFESIE